MYCRVSCPNHRRGSQQHNPFRHPSAWRRREQGSLFRPPWQADLVGESSKWKILDLLLDVSASTCLGMTVYLSRRAQTLEQIARLPVNSPSSVVTREVCPVLLRELLRWQRNIQQDKLLSTHSLLELYRQDQTQDVYLRCLLQFADHCVKATNSN